VRKEQRLPDLSLETTMELPTSILAFISYDNSRHESDRCGSFFSFLTTYSVFHIFRFSFYAIIMWKVFSLFL
jgi:hypothetical protein